MGGGGGFSGPFNSKSPDKVAEALRQPVDEVAAKEFEIALNRLLSDVLAAANTRDVDLLNERLAEIKAALSDELQSSVDSLLGGSVAKHTYVDGLSDVDSLLILNGSDCEGMKPSQAIAKIAELLGDRLPGKLELETGKLAVTIRYGDGMELQLLPAFKIGDRIRVPSFAADKWSGISPQEFQAALTDINRNCGSKLVPTIKLAKAIMGNLPEKQRLSGYHTESLAIEIFKNYNGTRTTASMLPEFFKAASERVLRPITDKTGQSRHVDDSLGSAGSIERRTLSHILARIHKRMTNASSQQSQGRWSAILGVNDGA